MLSISFVILLLLLGYWLIRVSRSISKVATVMNEHEVTFDFLGYQGRANAVLLFSDIRFVAWLIRKKYDESSLPPPVSMALNEARRSYLLIVAVFLLIVILGFSIALYNRGAG